MTGVQTCALPISNAERFITPELKELETQILEAEEKSVDLEYQLFLAVREEVKKEIGRASCRERV